MRVNPTLSQKYVAVKVGDVTKLDYVFEGIVVNSKVDHFVPLLCSATSENPRVQLQPGTTRSEYTKTYNEQLRNIIEGYDIYEGNEQPIGFEYKRPTKQRTGTKSKKNHPDHPSAPRLVKEVPGMFPRGTDRGIFSNWIAAANVVKGGDNYQHAHCDQGR